MQDKMEKLQSQIDNLKNKQNKLYAKMELKIITLIKQENLLDMDFHTLYGAIADLAENIQKSSPDTKDQWKHKGEALLLKKKKIQA